MRARQRLLLIFGVVLLALAAGSYALPTVVRHVAVARIRAITHRPVSIGGLDLSLLSGRITIHDLRIAERDGRTPFAGFERLDLRVRFLPLVRGHIWVRDLVLRNPTVRVIRLPDGFNLSDLIQGSGEKTGEPYDVTVEQFALIGGTATLEDRALPEPRTWASQSIAIAGRNLSTQRDDGEAYGTSVTAGAATSVEMRKMRLYPIHFESTMTTTGLDLALARLYIPAGAPVTVERGRASSTLRVTLDARTGLRADATGELEDVVLVRPGEAEPLALVPKLSSRLTGFAFDRGRVQVGQFEVTGSASVRDPTAGPRARTQLSKVRASIADVTWPITTPGRLDVETAVPGGGTATLAGTLRPPPEASQVRLRLAGVDLAPWSRLLPVAARITGLGEADLRVDEPLAVGVPARVRGSIAVNRLAMGDGRRELASAQRVEVAGLEARWPERIGVDRLVITGPRAVVERDKAGAFPVKALLARSGPPSAGAPSPRARAKATPPTPPGPTPQVPTPQIEVREILVRGGSVAWHDEAVTPAARLELSQLEGTVTGGAWPLRQALGVRLAMRPPGGGQARVAGRVAMDPFAADMRVATTDADLAPYWPYVPTVARITGRADVDLAVVVPPGGDGPVTARGSAAVSRLDVRDQERSVMKADRIAATGLDLGWPGRLTGGRLVLTRAWVLLERDEQAALTLRTLLAPPVTSGRPSPLASANGKAQGQSQGFPVTFAEVVMDDGGARVVDRGVAPAFAVDLYHLAGRVDSFTTGASGKPARLELTGRVGNEGLLSLKGTVGPIGGPLRIDLDGNIRGVAMSRTNPYLVHHVAWEARDGWLTSSLRCRIDGNTLDARTEILLSRLQVARVSTQDGAQARLGLPLGLIVSLMKDRQGDIRIALPVGGRLNDPRFDFSEAIWSTVRNVALKTITAPVSWIGRVQSTSDARIQRIDIDPIPFVAGSPTLTPEGREQVTRLVAFLQQMPDTRMMLTPVVAPRELADGKARGLDAALERLVREAGTTREAAMARLFAERFPGRKPPEGPDALRAALEESEPALRKTTAAELGTQRVEAVRDMAKKAGVDTARLAKMGPLDSRDSAEPQVKLELVEPEGPAKTERRPAEFLRRLPGLRN